MTNTSLVLANVILVFAFMAAFYKLIRIAWVNSSYSRLSKEVEELEEIVAQIKDHTPFIMRTRNFGAIGILGWKSYEKIYDLALKTKREIEAMPVQSKELLSKLNCVLKSIIQLKLQERELEKDY